MSSTSLITINIRRFCSRGWMKRKERSSWHACLSLQNHLWSTNISSSSHIKYCELGYDGTLSVYVKAALLTMFHSQNRNLLSPIHFIRGNGNIINPSLVFSFPFSKLDDYVSFSLPYIHSYTKVPGSFPLIVSLVALLFAKKDEIHLSLWTMDKVYKF